MKQKTNIRGTGRQIGHTCFATLAGPTIERTLLSSDKIANNRGQFCYLIFSDAKFGVDNNTAKIIEHPQALVINEPTDLAKHWGGHKKRVILQSPYLEHYPDWFWDESKKHTNLTLVFNGYGISLSDWHKGHYDNDSYKYFHEIGSPDLFGFVGQLIRRPRKARWVADPVSVKIRGRVHQREHKIKRDILWAPHWSQVWFSNETGYSRFAGALAPITNHLKLNPCTSLTFRPHPILGQALASLVEGGLSESREVTITKNKILPVLPQFLEFISLPNVRTSSCSLVTDVLSHHRLVTEGVSIIAYWAMTGKQMAVFRDSQSPAFNLLGKLLMTFSTRVSSAEELSTWLSQPIVKSMSVKQTSLRLISRILIR